MLANCFSPKLKGETELSLVANQKEETQNKLLYTIQVKEREVTSFTRNTHIRISLASKKEMTKEPPPQTPLEAVQFS